jgi:hypothetical protein
MTIDQGNFVSSPEPSLERYSLDRTTIEAITEVLKMPGRMKEFAWPLELQGQGVNDELEKTILVRFPKGDIFLSFITTIHELGHIRQEEHDPSLKREHQTHANLLAQEMDAWQRGWARFIKSNPDELAVLESKFQNFRNQGKLGSLANFRQLYDWVRENALRMVEVQRILFEGAAEETELPNEQKFSQLADELKKAGIDGFLERYRDARVGEIVDESEMRKVIKKTVGLIVEE